jgi:very-short-patch-repair endonuclease
MDKNPLKPDDMWKGASPHIFSNGYKFRRQHPLSIYVADFYCHALKLVIEIDGDYHLAEGQQLLDRKRTSDIEFQGLKVIRFTNEEVLLKLSEVIDRIKEFISQP